MRLPGYVGVVVVGQGLNWTYRARLDSKGNAEGKVLLARNIKYPLRVSVEAIERNHPNKN